MTEFRKDPTSNEWILIASQRVKRPTNFIYPKKSKVDVDYVEDCPFCFGNERLTPPEKAVYRNSPESLLWKIRVIPNMFPAVSSERSNESSLIDNFFRTTSGYGFHEVIIESPFHNQTIVKLKISEIELIIRTYLDRFEDLAKDSIKYIMLFKNQGKLAGASINHIHSQIIAVPLISEYVRHKNEIALNYFKKTKRCLYCDINSKELKSEDRILYQNDDFLVFNPYASRYPFETWISPKHHQASFRNISSKEIKTLASILLETMVKIDHGLNNPDFNYLFYSAPIGKENSSHLHWYIQIVPRIHNFGGFEIGTGIYINIQSPEVSAKYLKEI